MQVLLVDGLNLLRRVHAGAAGQDDSPAAIDATLSSCSASLRRALSQHVPSHALCVFDAEGETWRHTLFPGYKAGRKPMPAGLRAALPRVEQVILELGLRSITIAGFEADDVIASMAVAIADRGGAARILSTDKKFCQLLRDGIQVFDHFAGHPLDTHYVLDKFGVRPEQLADCFSLTGDASLNIAGVRSIGPKTAARLLAGFPTLDALLNSADEVGGRTGRMLRADADAARQAHRLMALRLDVGIGANLRDFRYRS